MCLAIEHHFKPQTPQGDGNPIGTVNFEPKLHIFQTTNPARGRKLRFFDAVTPTLLSDFKPQTPQGDGNYKGTSYFCHASQKISNHKPRKGTETILSVIEPLPSRIISNHKPRKGTETKSWAERPDTRDFYFKPQTPQGDGNCCSSCLSILAIVEFQTTNPARGRKRTVPANSSRTAARAFQTTNPARGRKLHPTDGLMMSRCRISNHKPRKGTETAPVRAFPFLPYCISNHKPRKGTETTCRMTQAICSFVVFQTTNPARGRKRRSFPICFRAH